LTTFSSTMDVASSLGGAFVTGFAVVVIISENLDYKSCLFTLSLIKLLAEGTKIGTF